MTIGCSQFLSIVKGVPPAPSDPNSAENAMESIDLLDTTGIALNVNAQGGWIPSSNAYKNDGIYADTVIANGSIPIAFADMDVVETMQCTLGNTSLPQRNAMLAKLSRMRQAIEDFWTKDSQIDPVYLDWWAVSGAGHQYSLIKSLSFTVNRDSFDAQSLWEVTLVIKREPRWRGVWPGGNPLEWLFLSQGKVRGSPAGTGYDYQDLRLLENSNHFAFATIQNRCEVNPTGNITFLSQNFVDIANVPGDLPALTCIGLVGTYVITATSHQRIFVSQRVGKTNIKGLTALSPAETTNTFPAFDIINVGDNDSGAATKTIDACGVFSNGSAVNEYVGTYTVAAGVATVFTANVLRWTVSAQPRKMLNLWNGNWAAFVRCKATTGASNDVRIRLVVRASIHGSLPLEEVGIPLKAPGAACANEWAIVPLGQFKMPFEKNAFSGFVGRGLAADSGEIEFEIQTRNTNAAARAIEFLDVFFMPIDDAFSIVERTTDSGAAVTLDMSHVILDNTGYLAHGKPGDYAIGTDNTTNFYDTAQELKGTLPQLQPGLNNRLYFLSELIAIATPNIFSAPESTMVLRINVIPCWQGIRDV